MKTRNLLSALFLVTIVGILVPYGAALASQNRFLDEIHITVEEDSYAINISFNTPVRYLRHHPLDYGREIRIRIDPIVTSRDPLAQTKQRESLFPQTDNPAGVVRVEFERSDLIEPTLTLIFDRAKHYEVRQGADYRSLIVTLPRDKSREGGDGKVREPVAERPRVEKPVAPSAAGELSPQRQEELLREGEEATVRQDHARAVQVYTRLLDSADPQIRELAQFRLALSQEYQGYIAHAVAEYKNYLRDYPDGANAEKAENHLDSLLRAAPPGEAGERAPGRWQSEFFGSLSEFYDRDESFPEESDDQEDGSIVNYAILTTGVDATWRLSNEKYAAEAVVIGSHENVLEGGRENRLRTNAAYLDVGDYDRTFSSRLGRQTGNNGGVYSRFDGGRGGYRLTDKVKANLIAGYPVNLSYDGLDTDRYFYGVNFDLGRFADHWDFNTYVINQVADDVDDRQAVGLETRFVADRGSFMNLIDYDFLYEEVALFLFVGNWLLPNGQTRFNVSTDFRTNPLLATNNALIGQTSTSLDDLRDYLGESVLHQLARDRTQDSSFVTIGLYHPWTEEIQLAGDVAWSKLDGAPASGGVEAIDSTGDEYYYSLQLIGNDLIKPGSIGTLTLRYEDTQPRDTYSVLLHTRYPLWQSLQLNPKLRVDYRSNKDDPGDQWRFRPGLRLEYLVTRQWRVEIEGEYSYANRELEGLAEDKEGYYLLAGVRWDF